MIIDSPRTVGGASSLIVTAPQITNAYFTTPSDSYDLGTDWDNLGWFPGDGEPMFMRFQVTEDFVGATAVCNFYWSMSNDPNPAAGATIIMAKTGGPVRSIVSSPAAACLINFGLMAADLTVGKSITMPLTGFDPATFGPPLVSFRTHRYLSVGIYLETSDAAVCVPGPVAFTTGKIQAHLCKQAERDRSQRHILPGRRIV